MSYTLERIQEELHVYNLSLLALPPPPSSGAVCMMGEGRKDGMELWAGAYTTYTGGG